MRDVNRFSVLILPASDLAKAKTKGDDRTIDMFAQPLVEKHVQHRGFVDSHGHYHAPHEQIHHVAIADQGKPPAKQQDAMKTSKRMSYAEAVSKNMEHMQTTRDEWSAVGVSGMDKTAGPGGKEIMMPVFDMPQGYKKAPTLFPAQGTEANCELCSTPIKNVYWIKNDKRKWIMAVGSECVTHFNEGESGEKLAKRSMQEQNRDFLREAVKIRDLLWDSSEFTFSNKEGARKVGALLLKLEKIIGERAADEKHHKTFSGMIHIRASSDVTITRWIKQTRDAVTNLVREAKPVLEQVVDTYCFGQTTLGDALARAQKAGYRGPNWSDAIVYRKEDNYYITAMDARRRLLEAAGWTDIGAVRDVVNR